MNPWTSAIVNVLLPLSILVIPAILFLITQQNALRTIKSENRLMPPGQVWLQLIPLFGLIWQFFVINRIAGSIQKQRESRYADSIFGEDAILTEESGKKRPTWGIGVTYAVLDTIVFFLALIQVKAGLLQGLISWSMIVCWIIYWFQLARYKNKLKRNPA